MPELVLSGGFIVQSEKVKYAEYYPCGSLRSDSFVKGFPIQHEQDFLFIRLSDDTVRVRGHRAEGDANVLEQAGVRVYRRPSLVL
jgi:hypothetical protein